MWFVNVLGETKTPTHTEHNFSPYKLHVSDHWHSKLYIILSYVSSANNFTKITWLTGKESNFCPYAFYTHLWLVDMYLHRRGFRYLKQRACLILYQLVQENKNPLNRTQQRTFTCCFDDRWLHELPFPGLNLLFKGLLNWQQ